MGIGAVGAGEPARRSLGIGTPTGLAAGCAWVEGMGAAAKALVDSVAREGGTCEDGPSDS